MMSAMGRALVTSRNACILNSETGSLWTVFTPPPLICMAWGNCQHFYGYQVCSESVLLILDGTCLILVFCRLWGE